MSVLDNGKGEESTHLKLKCDDREIWGKLAADSSEGVYMLPHIGGNLLPKLFLSKESENWCQPLFSSLRQAWHLDRSWIPSSLKSYVL